MMKKVIAIIISLLFQACDRYLTEFELTEHEFTSEQMQMIADETRLKLPKDAHGLNFYFKPPIDPAFAAKIRIPDSEVDALIQAISSIEDEEPNLLNDKLGPRHPWWIPPNANILVRRRSFATGNYFHATVTKENGQFLLYVEHAVF